MKAQQMKEKHRIFYKWAKCGECSTISEEGFCVDCWEFAFGTHACGASSSQYVMVEVRVI